ncbi:MAG: tetrathionate reductase family octaheme c-type cytochrome [Thiobacillus sp.]|nr:tetrathionate reductase family octaheme c-type cytochrome [Thiobacillus sp.]
MIKNPSRAGGCLARHALLACLLLVALNATAQTPATPDAAPARTEVKESTAEHGKFSQLKKPFKTGEEVTEACLSCHTEAAKQVMATRHWTWDYVNPSTGQRLGKKTMLNSFCIADRSNEAFCNACHVGYGWKDDRFDFSSERNVDCLACHNTGQYAKIPGLAGHPAYQRMEYPPGSGKFVEAVDLPKVARLVGKTSRSTCGACHFYGGGGDGVKHGDLDSSLKQPDRKLDVHMGVDGGNFTCATCHKTESHRIAGSRIAPTAADPHGAMLRGEKTDRNPATCQACHGDQPHQPGPGAGLLGSLTRGDRLNTHTRTLACQTCHIPAFARGGVPTKMFWDWSTAGTLDADGKPFQKKDEHGHVIFDSKKGDFRLGENVEPDYVWFDGRVDYTLKSDRIDPAHIVRINTFHGAAGEPDARIWPVKRFRGKQPYDLEHLTLLVPHTATPDDTALWFNYDWDRALAAGTAAAGQPFSGRFGFVETEMLWPITHMVAPGEQALGCAECHSRDGRLKAVSGVYLPGRDHHLLLDRAGFGLAGLALLGVLGHGTLRIFTRRQRKEHGNG